MLFLKIENLYNTKMLKINKDFSSPNFDDRPASGAITHVIIHFTEIPFKESIEILCDSKAKVSSHYIINEDGTIYSLISDDKRAWHAGKSYWGGIEALNNCSIGIELVNSGKEPFNEPIIHALTSLCGFLKNKYHIKKENFIGHSDVAPDRKVDPGAFFPWQRLAASGIGMWPGAALQEGRSQKIFGVGDRGVVVEGLQARLMRLGYKLEVTGVYDMQTCGVVRAFQAHFCSEDVIKAIGVEKFVEYKKIEDYPSLNGIYEWTSKCDHILDNLLKSSFL
ncbi:MAG: N-acetylmuramoyl-L-alanine amidase [Rickettsiaceae bacterium]|jgi:N-acetylmuramoyl-L-alanine amidase|nr:N-acetylmuramoyl-L-alanine amidase [Rickettsiaceae bacterium]